MDIIEIHKYFEAESLLEILDTCIETMDVLREKIRKEIYYDELH